MNAAGHIAGGKYFDGSDKFIEFPDHDDLSFGNGTDDFPFTLSAWFKPSEIVYDIYPVKKNHESLNGYELIKQRNL